MDFFLSVVLNVAKKQELKGGKYVCSIELTTSCPILWGKKSYFSFLFVILTCHFVPYEPMGRDYYGAGVLFSTLDLKEMGF